MGSFRVWGIEGRGDGAAAAAGRWEDGRGRKHREHGVAGGSSVQQEPQLGGGDVVDGRKAVGRQHHLRCAPPLFT